MNDFDDSFADINPLNTVTLVSDFFVPSTTDVIPDDCILNVEYKEGKKEGVAMVRTKKALCLQLLNSICV